MTHDNPLKVLGVPPALINRAYQSRKHPDDSGREIPQAELSKIRAYAESALRLLSREFHPDLPHGDAQIMATLTESADDVRNLDALEYYIFDLVGQGTLKNTAAAARFKTGQENADRALDSLTRLPEHVSQFSCLGISTPVSIIAALGENVCEVDVIDHDWAKVRVGRDFSAMLPLRFRTGRWEQRSGVDLERADGRTWHKLAKFDPWEEVRVIGTVAIPRSHVTGEWQQCRYRLGLGSGTTNDFPELQWTRGSETWYLPNLQLGTLDDVLSDADRSDNTALVLWKDGKFAVTGRILASKEVEFVEQ